MKDPKQHTARYRAALWGAILTMGVGWCAWLMPIGQRLVLLSYDLLILCLPVVVPDEVIIIYMDEKSYDTMEQSAVMWDRKEHAKLLDRLAGDQTRQVIFDIVLDEPGNPTDNQILAEAIAKHGQVVLGGAKVTSSTSGLRIVQLDLPLEMFLTNAAAWGILGVIGQSHSVIRRYYQGTSEEPDIAWAGACLMRPELKEQDPRGAVRWLRYYGPLGTIPHLSYSDVHRQPAGYFRGKTVFVGSHRTIPTSLQETDHFRTPHSLAGREMLPGVTFAATAYLNVIRGEALQRMSWRNQAMWMAVVSLIWGAGMVWLKTRWAAIAAGAGVVGVFLAAWWLCLESQVWFSWTVLAGAQIPFALVWSWTMRTRYARQEKVELVRQTETVRDEIKQLLQQEIASAPMASPISDHRLVRRVARGAYGEVWLATNTIGTYHAVKIVRRQAFDKAEPYEREFAGIKAFMPISRSHPHWVHILHVGRNEKEEFFYYVMEAADDLRQWDGIDPETYVPKTLSRVLKKEKWLTAGSCLDLMLALTDALEHLHRKNLIHRDIKPANIIYVGGLPKFADIGLVTQKASEEHAVTFVGTEGYLPPEGPGAPSADVYSLGRVAYTVAFGLPPDRFPELPDDLGQRMDAELLMELNTIIGRACDPELEFRYSTAAEFHADLLKLQREFGDKETKTM